MGLPKLLVSGLIRVQSWGGYPKPNLLGQIRIPPKKIGPLSELSVFFFGGGLRDVTHVTHVNNPLIMGTLWPCLV